MTPEAVDQIGLWVCGAICCWWSGKWFVKMTDF